MSIAWSLQDRRGFVGDKRALASTPTATYERNGEVAPQEKQQTVSCGTAWVVDTVQHPSAAAGDNCVACVAPRWSSSHEGHRFCLACTVGLSRHCRSDECSRPECTWRENLRRTG